MKFFANECRKKIRSGCQICTVISKSKKRWKIGRMGKKNRNGMERRAQNDPFPETSGKGSFHG